MPDKASSDSSPAVPFAGTNTVDLSPLVFDASEDSLLDVVDNLLNRGVVLDAELVLGLAGVDLVYVHLNALLCAADRVLPHDH